MASLRETKFKISTEKLLLQTKLLTILRFEVTKEVFLKKATNQTKIQSNELKKTYD